MVSPEFSRKSDPPPQTPRNGTSAGLAAKFLRLSDSPRASRQIWADSGGIFACFPASEPRPAATVYARFDDPDSGPEVEKPIFMASQRHGSGCVFYLGSGELWRLRANRESSFAQIYGQILNFVSRGRFTHEPAIRSRLRWALACLADQACGMWLSGRTATVASIASPLIRRAADALERWLASRIVDLDYFHDVVEELEGLKDSQDKIVIAAREKQKAALAASAGN